MSTLGNFQNIPTLKNTGIKRAPASSKLIIGDRAPYFSLIGTDDRVYSLSDFSKNRATAIIFIGNRCPYCRQIESQLVALQQRYKNLGLGIIAICSNDGESYPEDSFECMLATSQRAQFSFPYLHDKDQKIARAYDAACTPEAFLFDSYFKLQYHGQPDITQNNETSIEHSALIRAIDAVLLGQKVHVRFTECHGSSIKWKDSID